MQLGSGGALQKRTARRSSVVKNSSAAPVERTLIGDEGAVRREKQMLGGVGKIKQEIDQAAARRSRRRVAAT
jgi:hypothetical protein